MSPPFQQKCAVFVNSLKITVCAHALLHQARLHGDEETIYYLCNSTHVSLAMAKQGLNVLHIRKSGPPGWGSLRRDSKVWLWVLCDSDHWVIAPQPADLSSRQKGRPTEKRQQPSDRKSYQVTSSKVGSTPRHTDWLTVVM
jgi:hypothetical protein